MRTLSRLEKTLFRLQAQHACLSWLFGEISGLSGVVVELGLGHGRTFDHLNRHLPDRDIYAFDRANDAYDDCQPDPRFLVLGEIEQTLPQLHDRIGGRIVLANSDIGSFDQERNRANAAMMSRVLPPMIAPGGFIMSDLPLTIPDFESLPLPAGAPEGRYFLYRQPA
ncbi:MAG: class I SAM-dependent methyltransferase [Beijerinckiaceae bacterium]